MAQSIIHSKRARISLLFGFLLALIAGGSFAILGKSPLPSNPPEGSNRLNLQKAYGQLPLSFEANRGQSDPKVKFLSRVGGNTFFFTPQETIFRFRNGGTQGSVLKMQFTGGRPNPTIQSSVPLSGKHHYFIGNDPKKWVQNVPLSSQIKYEALYPGIDLVYYGNQGHLEFDFMLQPGASPETILLTYQGLKKMELDPKGNLVLHTETGKLIHHKPIVYQEIDGKRKTIDGNYVLKGKNEVGFLIAAYDRSRTLVIDPVLSYSTYLGGSGTDQGNAIAVDSGGNAYVTGQAGSADFPTTPGSFDTALGGTSDAFVTKLNPTGTALVYSTFLGGGSSDHGGGIAVDSSGNAFVTGQTFSANFPTTPLAFDTVFNGGFADIFVTKLNPTGTALVYSTYLGGAGVFETGKAIAIDSSGNAYVTGFTTAANFPTTVGAVDLTCGTDGTCLGGTKDDGYVTKLNAAGSALVYSTYLGGSGNDDGNGIAVDAGGNALVTGNTGSTDFPLMNPFQIDKAGQDAFVTKINPAGSAFVYSTYLGGNNFDMGFDIAVDGSGNAYATGMASSTDFPTTPGVFDPTCGDGAVSSAYAVKLSPTGTQVYGTCLGGTTAYQHGRGIAVDSAGNAYVTGMTQSTNFPTTPGTLDATCGTDGNCNAGKDDIFLTKLNPTATALLYSTYLGGSDSDSIVGGKTIALDSAGNAYLTGNTSSPDFPTTPGAFDTTLGGTTDAFVAKISPSADLTISKDDSPDPVATGGQVTYTITVKNNGPEDATGVTLTDTLPTGVGFVSAAPAGCTQAAGTVTCNLGDLTKGISATVTIVVTAPSTAATLTNTATVAADEVDPTSPNTATATTAVQVIGATGTGGGTPAPSATDGRVSGGGCSLQK